MVAENCELTKLTHKLTCVLCKAGVMCGSALSVSKEAQDSEHKHAQDRAGAGK